MPVVNNGMNFRDSKKPLTIFFIDGMVPTPDDKTQAAALPGRVTFRNVRFIDPTHHLEPCDFVAGLVPPSYAKIPVAVAAGASLPASPATAAPVSQSPPLGAGAPLQGTPGRRGRPPAVQAAIPTPTGGWGTK